MVIESVSVGKTVSFHPKWGVTRRAHSYYSQLISSGVRASQSMEDKNNVYKQVGLFSLRKKIEDAVVRAEMTAPTALELEEAKQINHEEMIRKVNLWDDLAKSNEILNSLADTTKVVDALKDVRYKAEEAKLITELAEMDVINHQLFKQAYNASVDVSKFLDRYEMLKLLSGPYDMEGACVIITAGPAGIYSEMWAEKLLTMYTKWGEKQGYKGRVTEKYPSKVGIKSATIEFESEYVYGYLSGERGTHRMIRSSLDGSIFHETSVAGVDVIPLFLETPPDLPMGNEDLEITSLLPSGEEQLGYRTEPAISIGHIPTGIMIQCSGERSHFANKIKALNRLKAKLLVISLEQGVSNVKNIRRDAIATVLEQEGRRYVFHPYKLVHDVKTGIQLPDLTSVLDGNIEPLIGAHISTRQTKDNS